MQHKTHRIVYITLAKVVSWALKALNILINSMITSIPFLGRDKIIHDFKFSIGDWKSFVEESLRKHKSVQLCYSDQSSNGCCNFYGYV